jgi:transposase
MFFNDDYDSQFEAQVVSIDDLVPTDHLVRKIARVIDFSFINDQVRHLYSEDQGRPSIPPIVLFKMVFIQFIFGIRSMRKTVQEIQVNAAYRWFLGFGLMQPVPHYSTFSKNYERRFKGSDIFETIFHRILKQIVDRGLINEEVLFVDSTHMKAYANKRKSRNEVVQEATNRYMKQLQIELNELREEEGKKQIDFTTSKNIAVSPVDPDAGMFHKGEKEKQFAYSVQTACDEHGWVIASEVHAANISDHNAGASFIEPLLDQHPDTTHVVMDAGYNNPLLLHEILLKGRKPVVPYMRPKGGSSDENFPKSRFDYDDYNDTYTCPAGKLLTYRGINSQGYRQYQSNRKDCQHCPFKDRCTKTSSRIVLRHLLEYSKKIAREIRLSEEGRSLYAKRKMTIERVFADCKMNHVLGFTFHRGLKKNQHRIKLLFAMANLKKLAIIEWDYISKSLENSAIILQISLFLSKLRQLTKETKKWLLNQFSKTTLSTV